MKKSETKTEETQKKKPWLRKFAPLVFVDYGRAKMKDAVAGEEDVHEISSVGGGLLVELGDNLSLATYYGWPLRAIEGTDRGDGRLNLSLIVRW